MTEITRISRREFLKLLLSSGAAIFTLAKLKVPLAHSILGFSYDTVRQSYRTISMESNDNNNDNINSLIEFKVGVNHPWFGKYGTDIGYNQFSSIPLWNTPSAEEVPIDLSKPDPNPPKPYLSDHPQEIENFFQKVHGIDLVRIWLFEGIEGLRFDGNQNNKLIGIDSELIRNIEKILDTAQKYDIQVLPTLLNSWDSTFGSPPGGLTEKRLESYNKMKDARRAILQSIVKNPDDFSNMVIAPLVKQIKEHPALYAIDLVNEPEYMLEGQISDAVVKEDDMNNFIRKCALAIGNMMLPPKKVNVTVGCEKAETAQRYSALPIDFAQVHVYRSEEYKEIEVYDPSQYNGKPCLIGECGYSKTRDENNKEANEVAVTEKIVNDAKFKGYAGALVWELLDGEFISEEHGSEILAWLKIKIKG
jgi:hypothetical protein